MEPGDWKAALLANNVRQAMVTRITDALLRPIRNCYRARSISNIRALVVRVEEYVYSIATSKSDYLRKIHEEERKMKRLSTKVANKVRAACSRPPAPDLKATSDRSPRPPNEDSTMENEATGELRAQDKEFSTKTETLQASHRAGDESAIEKIMDLFEGDDAFEEFELDQEADLEGGEEASEVSHPWQDEWDDYDDGDDFSVRLKRELEKNKPKE